MCAYAFLVVLAPSFRASFRAASMQLPCSFHVASMCKKLGKAKFSSAGGQDFHGFWSSPGSVSRRWGGL